MRNARRLRPGDALTIERAPDLPVRVVRRTEDGGVLLDLGPDQDAVLAALDRAGEVPLPPYIARPDGPLPEDREDYQAIFARRPGAVAAPTASLHFTEAMLAALDARGVRRATVTLHVGAGTFLPLRGETRAPSACTPNGARCRRKPPPSSTRPARPAAGSSPSAPPRSASLKRRPTDGDSWARPARPFRGLTDLFLLPGHRFRSADALMTNFHLPRSSLFMLVCAFAGTERMRAAYAHAIARRLPLLQLRRRQPALPRRERRRHDASAGPPPPRTAPRAPACCTPRTGRWKRRSSCPSAPPARSRR